MFDSQRRMLGALMLVAAVSFPSGAAFGEEAFDYARFDALDQRVVAADEALLAEEAGSPEWNDAARAAAGAREALIAYINATIADPALGDEERETLGLFRATMSIDRAQLAVRLDDCGGADAWLQAAREDIHPDLADALAAAEAAEAECRDAVAVAPPPVVAESAPTADVGTPGGDEGQGAVGLTEPAGTELAEPTPDESGRTTAPIAPVDLVEAPDQDGRATAVGWSLVGVGIALGGTALAIDAAGASDRRTIDELGCGETPCTDPDDRAAYSAADSAENRRLVPIVALGTLGLGTGIAGIVKLTRRGHTDDGADVAVGWTGAGVDARVSW